MDVKRTVRWYILSRCWFSFSYEQCFAIPIQVKEGQGGENDFIVYVRKSIRAFKNKKAENNFFSVLIELKEKRKKYLR